MEVARFRPALSALIVAFVFCMMLAGALGISSAHAQTLEREDVSTVVPIVPEQTIPVPLVTAAFTEPLPVSVFDLGGNLVSDAGVHVGAVECDTLCSQSISLQVAGTEHQYFFRTRLDEDPVERRLVVGGKGYLPNSGKKNTKFTFMATYEDNNDGTIAVIYESSNADASFIIPSAPGEMQFGDDDGGGPVID